MEDLVVEVCGENGALYKGYVLDVLEEEVLIHFEDEWQPDSNFPYSRLRFPPKPDPKAEFVENQEVEVFSRSNTQEANGWWKCRIKMMKGDFYVLEYTGWDNSYNEIVSSDRIRQKNVSPPLDRTMFHKFEIEVPEDIREYAKVESAHKEFQKAIGAGIIRYIPDRGVLIVISRCESSRKRAAMLQEMHFRSLQQKVLLLKRTEEAARQLESTKLATVGGKFKPMYHRVSNFETGRAGSRNCSVRRQIRRSHSRAFSKSSSKSPGQLTLTASSSSSIDDSSINLDSINSCGDPPTEIHSSTKNSETSGDDNDSETSDDDSVFSNETQCSGVLSNDPAYWNPITEDLRRHWINLGPSTCQNNPMRTYSKRAFEKTLKNGEKINRDWLLYSPSKDTLFCFVCVLFSSARTPIGNVGFCNWKHVTSRVTEHENSAAHKSHMTAYHERRAAAKFADIATVKQRESDKLYWRNALQRIVAIVKFQSKDSGSFTLTSNRNCVELLSRFDPFLEAHVKRYGKNNSSYFSPNVFKYVVQLMAGEVLKKIVDEVKTSKYYSIGMNSIGNCDNRLCFAVRYVKDDAPVERFLKFVHDGSVADVFEFLETHGLALRDCRGQSYDNAPHVSRKYTTMQARIEGVDGSAGCFPYLKQPLNLIAVNAASWVLQMGCYFEFLQRLYSFFSSATRHWDIFVQNTKSNVTRTFAEITWASRADAVKTLHENYADVKQALRSFANGDDHPRSAIIESGALADKMDRMETLFLTIFWNDILAHLNVTNETLQAHDVNLITVVELITSSYSYIAGLRDSFEIYEELANSKAQEGASYDKSSQANCYMSYLGIVSDSSGSDYFDEETFATAIDAILMDLKEIKDMYVALHGKFGYLESLLSTSDKEIKRRSFELAEMYSADVDRGELSSECLHLKGMLRATASKNCTIKSIYKEVRRLKSGFPNVEVVLRIFLSLMVTSCAGERSRAKVNVIKKAFGNWVGDGNSDDVAILSVESELLDGMTFEESIDDFVAMKCDGGVV